LVLHPFRRCEVLHAQLLRSLSLALLFTTSTQSWLALFVAWFNTTTGGLRSCDPPSAQWNISAYQTEISTRVQGKFDFDGLPNTAFRLTIEGTRLPSLRQLIDITVRRMGTRLSRSASTEIPREASAAEGPRVRDRPHRPDSTEARREFDLGEPNACSDTPGSVEHFQKAIALYATYAEAYQLLAWRIWRWARRPTLRPNCRSSGT